MSWATILKKRGNYRQAFDGFDPASVAQIRREGRRRLLADAGIVRNRLKIDSAISNAKSFLAVQKELGSFDQLHLAIRRRPAEAKCLAGDEACAR